MLARLTASSKAMTGDGARLLLYTRSITSHAPFFLSTSTPFDVDLSLRITKRGKEDAIGFKRV